MLPFLTRTKEPSAVGSPSPINMNHREDDPESVEDFDSVEMAMEELHKALNAGRFGEAAEIFRSAFQLCEEEPHKEGPHKKEDKEEKKEKKKDKEKD